MVTLHSYSARCCGFVLRKRPCCSGNSASMGGDSVLTTAKTSGRLSVCETTARGRSTPLGGLSSLQCGEVVSPSDTCVAHHAVVHLNRWTVNTWTAREWSRLKQLWLGRSVGEILHVGKRGNPAMGETSPHLRSYKLNETSGAIFLFAAVRATRGSHTAIISASFRKLQAHSEKIAQASFTKK